MEPKTTMETGAIIPAEENGLARINEPDIETAEGKIRAALSKEKKIKNELKLKRSMIKSALEQDAEYYKANEAVKEYQRHRKVIKDKLMKANPALRQMSEQTSILKEELKSVQLSLSDYLLEYHEETGMTTFEDSDKTVRRILIGKTAHVA